MNEPVPRHHTALNRNQVSRPVRLTLESNLIQNNSTILDFGCGKGDDVRYLKKNGYKCIGWDPYYSPETKRKPSDIVNLGYVINVIEDHKERVEVLQKAWTYAKKILIVSARHNLEQKDEGLIVFQDGFLTRRKTFQKYYQQNELKTWIDESLNESSLAAAPGIFYVFRDAELKQSYIASSYRRRSSAPRQRISDILFEKNKTLLEPLMQFLSGRGRLPITEELDDANEIISELGSLKKAFRVIKHATGSEQWENIKADRTQDLLTYLALVRFDGRPTFGRLSNDLKLDVRAFCSTYKRACEMADQLLYSAGDQGIIDQACCEAKIGKLTPTALYIHSSALPQLPQVLRIYEGCAQGYVGKVEKANIIKLNRRKPQVSYLWYPDFGKDPHPALRGSIIVPLNKPKTKYRDYTNSNNPFILHRKEEFITEDNPLKKKFSKLTKQEERHGLFENTSIIGTRDGWNQELELRGLKLSGHRVLKKKA
jgi:DNA phosphorothioation-associated putative methyltransferase